MRYLSIIIILFCSRGSKGDDVTTRLMYDTMAQLVGDPEYPDEWWTERNECFNKLSPGLIDSLDLAWTGFIKYWEMRGQKGDMWVSCDTDEARWFESNCTIQPIVDISIWEPCNYVSNLAYDRLALEICNQENWTIDELDIRRIGEAFALVTFGSSFWHGSETRLGKDQDTKSNDLFTYILHQASLAHIPYDPILHDLSVAPRNRSANQIVEYWLDMVSTQDVSDWSQTFHEIDVPNLMFTFSGILSHIIMLDYGYNTTVEIAVPLMDLFGVDEEYRQFIFDLYLPLLEEHIGHISLSILEKAELLENAVGTVLKLFYAFFWQESIIDLGDLNTSPEINAAGAAFTPTLNSFANNLTRWDLTVEDVQLGGGYPGSHGCNDLIPHAKWHAQTSAALADMTRLVDFIVGLEKKYSLNKV